MSGPAIVSQSSFQIPVRYIPITGLRIDDAAAASNPGKMFTSVTCQHGTMSMKDAAGNWIPGSFKNEIKMTATFTEINTALSHLVYKCFPGTTSDTITVVVWDQYGANASATITIGAPSVGPVTAPSPAPSPSPSINAIVARRARELSKMFAVNTHIDFGPTNITPQYADFAKLSESINYIWQGSGLSPLLRDWAGNPNDTSWWTQIAASTNAKFIASIGETTAANYSNYVSTALSMPNLIAYLDGPNEEDSAAANGLTNGMSETDSLNAAAAYMPTLWNTAQQHGLPLINMSYGQGWGTAYDPNFQHGYYGINGDLGPFCTYGNAHTYPQNGDPPLYSINLLNVAAQRAASKPVAITEFGYTIAGQGNNSVPQDVQAKYALMGLFDAFAARDVLFGWYALYDDMSGSWGLFNADYSPRPAATAIHNVMAVLNDPRANADTFTPGKLGFVLTGTCAHVIVQKSDGSFWLALWNEQKLRTGQNPITNITLTLSSPAKQIAMFDPMIGTAATILATNVAEATVPVPAHPILVQIVH